MAEVLASPGAVVGFRGPNYAYRFNENGGQPQFNINGVVGKDILVLQEDGTCKWMSAAEMEGKWDLLRKVKDGLRPYAQFTLTWNEAVETHNLGSLEADRIDAP